MSDAPLPPTLKSRHASPDNSERSASRRQFLSRSSAVVGGLATLSLVGSAAAAIRPKVAPATPEPPGVPSWSKEIGTATGAPYGNPSKYEADVVRKLYPGLTQSITAYSTTPLQDLDGAITPNGLFYERHHAGVPQIDPARHRLMIHGLVKAPLLFTVDDVHQFPSVSRVHFLECAGNPSFRPPWGKTAAEVSGLVSCAEWTGVPLSTLLKDAGLKPGAKWVIAEGADGAGMTRSIPIDKCMDDAMIAYSQNGERLRPEQGYPMRLLLPGFEGNMNIKWLRRLHVSDTPAYSREETAKYTDLMADGRARKFSFVMECKSIITKPSGEQRLSRKGFHEIRGIAWSGRGKITRVDVSIDGGDNWFEATLQGAAQSKALTSFRAPFEWHGEEMMIMSRAIDETGYVQPTMEELVKARGWDSFYHNNTIQPWKIAATGEVTNGRGV